MKQRHLLVILAIVVLGVTAAHMRRAYSVAHAQSERPPAPAFQVDRTVLPIREPAPPESTVLDARNATPPPRFEVKAPASAPNVLIVLIDDMGGSASRAHSVVPSTCQERLGGTATLFVNGTRVASGRIEQTQCCAFSIDEGTDVGEDTGTPVSSAYTSPFRFTGKISTVTVTLAKQEATR